MPKCCVETCGNNQMKKSEYPWLTFHFFPKDPDLRNLWIKAVGRQNWEPRTCSAVCSVHFNKDDFRYTKKGGRRLKQGAIPIVDGIYDLNELCARLRVCRICLSLDRKTYYMGGCNLEDMYTSMTGRRVFDDVGRLPPQLCWECAARLTTAANFRDKAIMTDKILHRFLDKNPSLKIRDVIKLCSANTKVKSSFVIDRASDSIDGKESIAGIVKSDLSLPNYEINTVQNLVEIPVKNEIEIDATQGFYNFDPNAVKTEVDMVTTDITDNSDAIEHSINNDYVKTEIDLIPNDITSNSNDITSISDVMQGDDSIDIKAFYHEENTEIKEKVASKVFVNTEILKQRKKVKPRKERITPVVVSKKEKLSRPIDETLYTVKHLTEEQELKDLMNRQHTLRYINSIFKCNVCFKGFPTKDKFERHELKHSEKMGPHACRICKIRCKTKSRLRMHMLRQHTFEISCNQCPFVTRCRTLVFKHMNYHAGNKYKCRHCDSVFEKQTTYLNHLRLKHMSHFVCELCGYTFVSTQGVLTHKKIKHPLFSKDITWDGPSCEICDVIFLSQKAYDRHLKLSSKHIKSEDDPNRISNDPSIKSRQLARISRKPVRRTVIRPKDRNAVPQNKNVTCEQCGEIFSNLLGYVVHFKKSHPGKNRTKYSTQGTPYLCELCGKIFTNYTILSYHMWVHTGVKRYQCDHCQKTFSVKANLANHMSVHNSSRQSYDCRVCGKQFAFSFNRTRHMFLHTGLKPFKCDACEKCFVTSGELKSHVDYVHLKKPRPKRARRRIKKTETTEDY